jgi:hypothetical protein
MRFAAIGLVAALTMTGSFASAQAPIGSSADFGNGAVLNRGPVTTTGEDLDFRTNRAYSSPRFVRHHRRFVAHRHRHVAERAR